MANETTSAPLSVPSYCMVEFAVCREKTNLALYYECGPMYLLAPQGALVVVTV